MIVSPDPVFTEGYATRGRMVWAGYECQCEGEWGGRNCEYESWSCGAQTLSKMKQNASPTTKDRVCVTF